MQTCNQQVSQLENHPDEKKVYCSQPRLVSPRTPQGYGWLWMVQEEEARPFPYCFRCRFPPFAFIPLPLPQMGPIPDSFPIPARCTFLRHTVAGAPEPQPREQEELEQLTC